MAQPDTQKKQYNEEHKEFEAAWNFLFGKSKPVPQNKEVFLKTLQNESDYLLTDWMEDYVEKTLRNALTKTQMRNLFEEVKNTDPKNFAKLKVRLIYTAGKIDNQHVKVFIRLLIDLMKFDSNFGKDFIESALAYHKFSKAKS